MFLVTLSYVADPDNNFDISSNDILSFFKNQFLKIKLRIQCIIIFICKNKHYIRSVLLVYFHCRSVWAHSRDSGRKIKYLIFPTLPYFSQPGTGNT